MKWLLAALLFLTACGSEGGDGLYRVEARCGANSGSFAETWPCVRTNAASLPGPPDLKQYYFRTGDLVAERVRDGSISETEARMVMADALTKLISLDSARMPPESAYRPTTYQRTGPQTVIGY